MYIHCQFEDGENAAIVMRRETEARLLEKCFRGSDVQCAGNFKKWNDAKELFEDPHVLEEFLEVLYDNTADIHDGSMTFSYTILYPEIVGWTSTDELSKYSEFDLEPFELNRRSNGLRVRMDTRSNLRAPRTHSITIVYELRLENETKWVAIIHSIYPGIDVGELHGDVSQREGVVFFDWSHPGA